MTIEDALTLSKEQKEILLKRKIDKFLKEYNKLCEEHRLSLVPYLKYSPYGILVDLKVNEIKKEKEDKEKINNKK